MMNEDLRSSAVVNYPYLWRWQRDGGETEGRKDRPVCVVLAVRRDEVTHLALFAISSRPPDGDHTAIEVPEIECKRAGLSEFKRAGVTTSEYNYDVAERSFYLDLDGPFLGRFSRSFMMQLASAVAPLFGKHKARIDRID
jgi:hypothetical protein